MTATAYGIKPAKLTRATIQPATITKTKATPKKLKLVTKAKSPQKSGARIKEAVPSSDLAIPNDMTTWEDRACRMAKFMVAVDDLQPGHLILGISDRLRESPAFCELALHTVPGQRRTLEDLLNDYDLQILCAYVFLAGQIAATNERFRRERTFGLDDIEDKGHQDVIRTLLRRHSAEEHPDLYGQNPERPSK